MSINKPDIREMTLERGLDFPDDVELLMMIIGSGTKDMHVEQLAMKVHEVIDSTKREDLISRLSEIKGVGATRALTIASAIEFGRRYAMPIGARICVASDFIPYVKGYTMKKQEHFICATLNGHHQIIQIHVISVGTINRTLIHPREVFMPAITENASAVILCHNHPSGNVMPSDQDIDTTETLIEASKIIGIPILDHVIITSNDYFSFVQHGLLFSSS